MDQQIAIRQVRAEDYEIIRTLLEQEALHNQFFFEEDSPHNPANAAAGIVAASLDSSNINCGWLAFSDGKPAGIITTPQNLPGGVFVSETFRGQGIAQGLIQERERYFKETLGLREIERPVRADNRASILLHTEKLGYRFSEASQNLMRENPNLPGHTVLYLKKTL